MNSPTLFILATLTLLFTPGPTNTLLWASGARAGVHRSLHLLIGELAGYLSAIALIQATFAPLVQRVPQVQRLLALAAGFYICFLAFRMWTRAKNSAVNAPCIGWQKIFTATLLNPKSFIFALTIIPIGHAQAHWYFAALSLCILLAGFSWIVFGHFVGSAMGRDNLMFVNRLSSVVLTGFATYLIISAFG